jgi:hypothetical protein
MFRSLPPSMIHGELKTLRETTLIEKEKALLPMTSQLVPVVKEENRLLAEIKEKKEEIAALKAMLKQKERELTLVRANKFNMENAMTENHGATAHALRRAVVDQPTPKLVCPCPKDACRGYVFNDYKCSMCPTTICKKCRVVVEPENEHACNPEDVETVRVLIAECKPCPGCGAPSRKTEGCNQVWCMMCHQAWDWSTQRIETGYVHATDYFNYMRRNGNAIPPRPDGPLNAPQAACVNVGQTPVILPRLQNRYPGVITPAEHDFIQKRYQLMNEMRRDMDADVAERPPNNVDLRIKYLNGDIDDAKWKMMLYKRDKEYTFKSEIRRMRDAYVHIIQDAIRTFLASQTEDEVKTSLVNLHTVHDLMCKEYTSLANCFKSTRKSPFVK